MIQDQIDGADCEHDVRDDDGDPPASNPSDILLVEALEAGHGRGLCPGKPGVSSRPRCVIAVAVWRYPARVSQALVVDPQRRTAVTFTVSGNPWEVIAAWAKRHRYQLREPQTETVRLYQKGTGMLAAPRKAQFTLADDRVHLQAWVHVPLLARIVSLFLLPQEMGIQSGGFRAAVPRTMARDAINDLLAQVGASQVT